MVSKVFNLCFMHINIIIWSQKFRLTNPNGGFEKTQPASGSMRCSKNNSGSYLLSYPVRLKHSPPFTFNDHYFYFIIFNFTYQYCYFIG